MNDQLLEAVKIITENELSLSELRQKLNQMYVLAVCNAPEDETDNFTARSLAPAFLTLSEMLERLPQ